METKTINLYTFDELSKTAKEKAREWYTENGDHVDWDFYQSDCIEQIQQTMSKYASDFIVEKFYYSLSYSQGDGCCFTGSGKLFIDGDEYTLSITHNGQYYHEYMMSYELESTESGLIVHASGHCTDVAYSIGWDDLSEKLAQCRKLLLEICGEAQCISKSCEKIGYELIEDMDGVDDLLQVSEYTFTVDGERMD